MRETDSHDRQISHAFLLCFGRIPDAEETKLATAFFKQKQVSNGEEKQYRQLFATYCQALLATAEFRNLD